MPEFATAPPTRAVNVNVVEVGTVSTKKLPFIKVWYVPVEVTVLTIGAPGTKPCGADQVTVILDGELASETYPVIGRSAPA